MTNLKKTLAVVLAFAMILSMGAISTFAAYSDVAEGTVVSEAVSILSSLDILTGFEDGTFRPDETVTRAQMAAIICRTLGYENQAQSSMGTTVFADVPASHWASGYINVAQAQQIINGYGNGNYGPEDLVTYEQAVKMIVSALGYDLAAAGKGGYPTGYLAIASAKGITKNANGRVGDPAARSAIAVLVYNSLEVELMDQTSWSTGNDGDKWSDSTGRTILNYYLDIEKWEGVVSETPLTDAADNGYNKDDAPMLNLTESGKWDFDYDNYRLVPQTLPYKADASLVDDVNQYLGKKVVAYISEDFDAQTGNKMLKAIAEKQGVNASLTLSAIQLVGADTEANVIKYRKPGSTKIYDVALAAGISGWKNFKAISNADLKKAGTDDSKVTTEDFATALVNGGTIELIESNSSVAGYDKVIVTKYDSETVIESVENDRGLIKFEEYSSTDSLRRFDTEADDELAVVYKDGKVASLEDIAANDTVTMAQVNGNSVRVFYVSSASVTGTVDGWDPAKKEVTIAGEDYKPSMQSGYFSDVTVLKNKEGLFFLNVEGQIAYADASAAKGNYGLILNVGKSNSMGKYAIEVVLADGTVASYELASNVTYGDVDGNLDGEVDEASLAADVVAGNLATAMKNSVPTRAYDKNEAYTHTDSAANLIYEIKIRDGVVKTLKKVLVDAPLATNKYSEETMTLGAKSFDENTVMFALTEGTSGTAKVEEDDVQVGKAVQMLADEEQYSTVAYALENRVYTLALGYDLVASISVDSDALIVSGRKEVSYDDSVALKVTGIQAGEEVSYTIYNDTTYKSAGGKTLSDIAVGDVILVSTPNAEGIVGDFQIIYDRSLGTAPTAIAADVVAKDVYYHVSTVDEAKDASADFIWLGTGKTNVTAGTGADDKYIVMQRAANYTLVDYTEDASNPEIYEAGANKSLVGDIGIGGTESSTVFVRVVDEKLVEVVVYRTKD